MGTVLRLPTYTYYDSDAIQKPSSVSFIMDDTLLAKMRSWYQTYGESGIVQEWTGSDIMNGPTLVNTFLGFPLLSKKSGEVFLAIPEIENYDDALAPWVTDVLTKLYVPYNLHTGMTNDQPSKMIRASNGKTITGVPSFISQRTAYYVTRADLTAYIDDGRPSITYPTSNKCNYSFYFMILPEDLFSGDGFNPVYQSTGEHGIDRTLSVKVAVETTINGSAGEIDRIAIYINQTRQYFTLANAFSNVDPNGIDRTIFDNDNPYGEGGSATVGGGDGVRDPSMLDDTDGADIPDLPTISAADLGFITMYNPTAAQLKSLSDFMWSGAFDLVTYKKLFSDPMQSIIGLSIVPVQPSVGGSKSVKFGTIDSGITMNYLSTNYVQLDCGSVSVDKYIGCFIDNDPYTKISIYLPFIGIRQISADDCMGRSLHVVYNIDVLTGACACFIDVSGKGVLYSYNGSCITNVPLTSVNFSGAIQNAVSAIGSMIGMAAGMATGAAPITAMSAVGLATSAANTALNSKPQVQRSGNLGGSAGIMSILTPYVIIERPSLSVPNKVEEFVGQTSNITMNLGNCSGFTMCEYVHLDGLNATSEEIVEIESMLKAGVIL